MLSFMHFKSIQIKTKRSFFTAMKATTRRLPPNQTEANAKISALLSDLEMKAYLANKQNTADASSQIPHLMIEHIS